MPQSTDMPAEDRPLARLVSLDTLVSSPATAQPPPPPLPPPPTTAAATASTTTASTATDSTTSHSTALLPQMQQYQQERHVSYSGMRRSPVVTETLNTNIMSRDGGGWSKQHHHGTHSDGRAGGAQRQPAMPTTSVPLSLSPGHLQLPSDQPAGGKRRHAEPDMSGSSDSVPSHRYSGNQTLAPVSAMSAHEPSIRRLSGSNVSSNTPVSTPADYHRTMSSLDSHTRSMSVSASPTPASGNLAVARGMQNNGNSSARDAAAAADPASLHMRASSPSSSPTEPASATSLSTPRQPRHSDQQSHLEHRRAASSGEEASAAGTSQKRATHAPIPEHAEDVENPNSADPEGSGTPADQGGDPDNDTVSDKEGDAHRSQRRRLNQACLLCRKKKVRCDSVRPTCTNCKNRGIICMYPEVRKRGRPPRVYTFADLAPSDQPLPPELRNLISTHGNAVLPSTSAPGQRPASGVGSGGADRAGYGWQGAAASASGAFGSGDAVGADSGEAATPAYPPSDYDHSPALPPFGSSAGRGPSAISESLAQHHPAGRGLPDLMSISAPPLAVDQAVLDLFEYITPSFPIIHRQSFIQKIRRRAMFLPLWLSIHAVSSRFEPHYGSRHVPPPSHSAPSTHHHHYQQQQQHPSSDLPSDTQRPSGAIAGALYAEKAHAMLVNRFGPRQSRPVWLRNERGQMVTAQDSLGDTGGVTSNVTRQELIDLLQSHILLSIFYAGNAELDLAVEIHASAVKIAQRMGVNMMDDPIKLQDFSGIFSSAVAQNQRKRAQNWSSSADPNFISGSGPSTSGSRSQWQSMSHQPPPLPGGPNDVEMHEPDGSSYDPTRQTGSSNTADLRQSWIEFETLRRLWWSMFVLDRMYHMTAGSLRMIHIGSFRVRLPCSDLEWDSMHAQPTTVSPNTASANATGNQMQGLMVRTFGEAVMHTSLSEQAGNEIPATPGLDPDVYRYSAALAGLIDSVIDFGEDIRALVTPPLMEGTEILAQLRAEQRSSGGAGDYEHASARSAYGRYGMAARGEGSHPASRQYATAVWLGSRKSGSEYIQGNRSGWHSSSVGAAWPPDWRSRMRVLQERVSALEARFTEWYSSMPIAQYARKPYLYSQLPLQDRITYFHQQIVYYGGVIQLQSLIVMTQGLLLPDTVEEGHVSFGNGDGGIGLGTLTNMMWRSLMDMDPTSGPGQSAGHGDPRAQGHALEGSGEPVYGSRRRQFGVNSGWGPRRQYGSIGGGDDDAHYVPLDEDGNSPEIIREELQRMLQAAWRRCTEAATAMSAAVKRATAGRRVASSNPHTAYYDPTFRPQVLPPYRGDVVSGDSSSSKFGSARGALSSMTPAATAPGSMSHYERAPATGDMRESPQQPHSSGTMSHGSGDRPLYPPIDRRGSGPPAHAPYSQQMQPPYAATLPPVHNPNALADAAAGPGQVVDDATFFMRFNLFTCTAAYVGAYIHLQNLRLIPRWELSIQRHSEAVAKNNEMRSMHAAGSSSMAGVGLGDERGIGLLPDPQDIGALPPQLPPSLPPLPCTQEQAREAVRPLVRILEGISPYWRVSAQVAKLREMWRDVDGTELDSNPSPTVPSQRQWSGHQMQPPVPSYSHHLHPHPHQQHHHHGQPRLAHPPIPSPRPPSSHHNAGMPIPSLVDASQPQSQSQSQPQSQLPPPQQQQQYPHHRLSGGMPPPRP